MLACITGATGFIGSHLADYLIAEGTDVRALIRPTSNLRWLKDKPVELVQGDIRDAASLDRFLAGADEIYHIAGLVKARSEQEYFEANETSTRRMLEAAARVAPDIRRFLFVSSQTAAGPAESPEAPVTEESPCRPITAYGRSKLAAEKLVASFNGSIPSTIVRPPAVFGPRDTEILVYFKTVSRGLNSIIGFQDKRLNLIYSADLVDGIIKAARHPASVGQTYFIASERLYSWPEIAAITGKALGRKYLTLRIPHAVVYAVAGVAQTIAAVRGKAATLNIEKARDLTRRYWVCDAAKARRDLGFGERHTLDEAFARTIGWYRENGMLG